MTAKCLCLNCSGHLEFDAEDAGTEIECPHCQLATRLYVPAAARRPFNSERLIWWAIAITVIVCGVALLRYLASLDPDVARQGLGNILFAVLYAIGGLLVLAVIIVWIVFPFLVWKYLKRIEHNTRSAK